MASAKRAASDPLRDGGQAAVASATLSKGLRPAMYRNIGNLMRMTD